MLAVATTNTGLTFSCIHVKKLPKSLVVTSPPPLLLLMPTKAFSNSSIHKTHGAIASAKAIALRRFPSDSPTYFPINRPISRRNNGTSNKLAAALAFNDLPQPGTPEIRTPFGISTPKASAALMFLITLAFLLIQVLRLSRPPISSTVSLTFTISKMPDFLIICFFCSKITFRSSRVSSPSFE